jgi:hypothetical protein
MGNPANPSTSLPLTTTTYGSWAAMEEEEAMVVLEATPLKRMGMEAREVMVDMVVKVGKPRVPSKRVWQA